MLLVRVTDLETLETDLINLADISFHIAVNLEVVAVSRFSLVKEALIDMKKLDDSVVRVMVMNGEELFGTISFDKETDFGEDVGLEMKQWITLFESVEDDTYDGSLGEDDEEAPRVQVSFKVVPV